MKIIIYKYKKKHKASCYESSNAFADMKSGVALKSNSAYFLLEIKVLFFRILNFKNEIILLR